MRISVAALAATVALAATTVLAVGKDELWELKHADGRASRMGTMTQEVCVDRNPKEAIAQQDETGDCTITSIKDTGTQLSVAMTCPQGTMQLERTYNAARTEYQETTTVKMRGRDVVMKTAGRKIGSCDAKQRDMQLAAMQREGERQRADLQAQQADMRARQVQSCAAAAQDMQSGHLRYYAACNARGGCLDKLRGEDRSAAESCMRYAQEYCTRYQTMEGFRKAKGDKGGAQMCNLPPEEPRASLCPRAVATEDFRFVAQFCPDETKKLAQQHCVGRGYTSPRDKYSPLCAGSLADAEPETHDGSVKRQAEAEDGRRKRDEAAGKAKGLGILNSIADIVLGDKEGAPAPGTEQSPAAPSKPAAQQPASQPAASPAPQPTAAEGNAVEGAVNQGINMLKGLFGR